MQTETQQQFTALVMSNKRLIYGVINRYCNDASYRDDLYHDILLRAWRAYGSFKGAGSFDSWLCSIAKNTAIDSITRVKTRLVSLHHDNPIYSVIDEPYTEEPLPVFDTLSAKELETINLYIDGLKVKEIAEKLGEPANRVAVRMKRIKERLSKPKK